jgi:hypothetical protein
VFALRLHRTTAPVFLGSLTGTRLRHELDTLLAPGRPVVLDVSQLAVPFTPAVEVLSRALLAAEGWPTWALVAA